MILKIIEVNKIGSSEKAAFYEGTEIYTNVSYLESTGEQYKEINIFPSGAKLQLETGRVLSKDKKSIIPSKNKLQRKAYLLNNDGKTVEKLV